MEDKTILYVEDNYHNRRIVRKILTTRGYKVIEAEDGLVGYEMICELKPPLVLLDIALPHLDGMQIVQRLKSDKETRHIPVVALTASAMRGDRERFLEAGCDDYLSKPVRAYELIEMVERYYQPVNGAGESVKLDSQELDEEFDPVMDKVGAHSDIIENEDSQQPEIAQEPVTVEAVAPAVEEPSEPVAVALEPPAETKEPAPKKKPAAAKKKTAKAAKPKEEPKPKKKAAPKKASKPETKAQKVTAKAASSKASTPKKETKSQTKVKQVVVKTAPSKKSAKETAADIFMEKTIAEMLSSVVIQPPSPDVDFDHTDELAPKLEENVVGMLADIAAPPSTPDLEPAPPYEQETVGVQTSEEVAIPVSDTKPLEEYTPAQTAPPISDTKPLEEQVLAQPTPPISDTKPLEEPTQPEAAAAEIEVPAAAPVGDALWVIDANPTDSRLMKRLLAAKLKKETIEISPQDPPTSPDSLPALLLFGAPRVDDQLRVHLDSIRSIPGLSNIPYVVLVKEDPDPVRLENIAPDAGMVWLKEQLIDPGFLARLGDLLKPEAPKTQPASPAQDRPVASDSPRATVLVIEDISDSAALAEKILANNNYTPLLAESGEKGITIAKENLPDLILLDLGLPDVDGQTLIGILRADPDLQDTPVILCTAWPKETLEKMVEAYGFDGFISKPYKVAEFMQVIEAHT